LLISFLELDWIFCLPR